MVATRLAAARPILVLGELVEVCVLDRGGFGAASLLAGTDWFGITLGESDGANSVPRVDIRFN